MLFLCVNVEMENFVENKSNNFGLYQFDCLIHLKKSECNQISAALQMQANYSIAKYSLPPHRVCVCV